MADLAADVTSLGVSAPPMTPVHNSSNIAAVGYDGRALWIRFANQALYRFPDGTRQMMNEMLQAASPGQYFANEIRGAGIRGEKVEAAT